MKNKIDPEYTGWNFHDFKRWEKRALKLGCKVVRVKFAIKNPEWRAKKGETIVGRFNTFFNAGYLP